MYRVISSAILCAAILLVSSAVGWAETDDTPAGAYLLTLNTGTYLGDTLSSTNDLDWWKVTITGTGTLTWRVRSLSGGPGLTFVVYQNPGQTSGSPYVSRLVAPTDSDRVEWHCAQAGTYYMCVSGLTGQLNNGRYAVRADFEADPPRSSRRFPD